MGGPPRSSYLIGPVQLRELFNAQNFREKLLRGEVFQKRLKAMPADPSRRLPPGTLSVMSEYVDGRNRFLAEVHFYQHRDGTHTQHDPKRLILGGVALRAGPRTRRVRFLTAPVRSRIRAPRAAPAPPVT